MKTLCQYIGGSYLYGTATPESDIDERGVFMNTDPLHVYGFTKRENIVMQNATQDFMYHELTKFIQLATSANTQTLECLFAPISSFTQIDLLFKTLVIDMRYKFLNTDKLYKSLKGYLYNEMRLALGERSGQLGSKRKNALQENGFSHKNFVHLFRLAETGRQFFSSGVYLVRLTDANPGLHAFCMDVKCNPHNYTAEKLKQRAEDLIRCMDTAYESCSHKFFPNYDYCRYVLHEFYSKYTNQKSYINKTNLSF